MKNTFANNIVVPTPVGAIGYVRDWKQASGMTALRARVLRGHSVLVT